MSERIERLKDIKNSFYHPHGTEAGEAIFDALLCISETGLTKREYFSAKALVAMVSREPHHPQAVAQNAIMYADALIAELNKEPDGQ